MGIPAVMKNSWVLGGAAATLAVGGFGYAIGLERAKDVPQLGEMHSPRPDGYHLPEKRDGVRGDEFRAIAANGARAATVGALWGTALAGVGLLCVKRPITPGVLAKGTAVGAAISAAGSIAFRTTFANFDEADAAFGDSQKRWVRLEPFKGTNYVKRTPDNPMNRVLGYPD